LPECYEPNEYGQFGEKMKIRSDALRLGGYRLPTESEWEYACRAGAETSRYYGATVDLLPRYAWYSATSHARVWPVGTLLPNDLGFFDMLGNTHEWCQDRMFPFIVDASGTARDEIKDQETVVETNQRVIRGGAFVYPPVITRSASRNFSSPSMNGATSGFRPARTYP
jgi:formylglycine-generating enzyme required for sulfatase activity